jgi:hypothetical protein
MSYQRVLEPKRVKRIVAEYHPNLINAVKVSHRDGKYYIFDGQHTVAALKIKQNKEVVSVECKIYEGLTAADEAELFAQQNGISKDVTTIEKIRALYYAGNEKVAALIKTTESVGFKFKFTGGAATGYILAVAKAYQIFLTSEPYDYIQILKIIKAAWGGEPESLRKEMLGGIYFFSRLYRGEFDAETLSVRLSKVSPEKIIRDGKNNSILRGDARFAKEIFEIYNKQTRRGRLDYKFSK